MAGHIIAVMDDITVSNGTDKEMDDVKEDIFNKIIDKYLFKDIMDGYYIEDLKNIEIEDDFDDALDKYLDIDFWTISIDINVKSIYVYEYGLLTDEKMK